MRDNVAGHRKNVSSEILERYEGNGKGRVSEVSQLSLPLSLSFSSQDERKRMAPVGFQ